MILRTTLILAVLTSFVAAQFDDRLWLVQAAGAGPGQVFECDRDGSVINQYPGPQFGSGGVVKDLFLNRVWVCDDAAWNGFGQPTGALRAYEAGVGEVATVPMPGARAITMLSGGDVAVLLNRNPLQPSAVQVVPWSSVGGPLPSPITVGLNALQMVSGPGNVIWTLDSLSQTVTRISGTTALTITPTTSVAAVDRLVLLPSGQILITFQGQAVAAMLSSDGLTEVALFLPEPAIRVAADGDVSVYVIGASGQFYRVNTGTGQIVDQFPLPAGNFGAVIPVQRGGVWVEELNSATLTCYGFGGVVNSSFATQFATHTRGDPLGFEWATKTQPDADIDGDGVGSGLEVRRGTDMLASGDVPPQLVEIGGINGVIPMMISAPGRGNLPFVLLPSLSGARSLALGSDGHSAPYFELSVAGDSLTFLLLSSQTVASHFLGMPLGVLNANGTGYAAIDLSAFGAFPGLVNIYCCAIVFEPGFAAVSATTNPVCFDNTGTPCP